MMTKEERQELVAERKALYARLVNLRRAGDYFAGAADIRELAELQLKTIDLLLERL